MPLTGVNIDLPLQAHIPTDYVANERLRLQLYRRMGNIASIAEIAVLAQELTDRFGPLPKAVENLMFQLHLKVLAAQAQISTIGRDRERGNIVLKSDGGTFRSTCFAEETRQYGCGAAPRGAHCQRRHVAHQVGESVAGDSRNLMPPEHVLQWFGSSPSSTS
jgi:transcription-repair coupling factor (superfamily II helicase)